jgi:hypothetical protein
MTFDDTKGVIITAAHFQELKDYLRENHLIPYSIERPVFDEELMICGTYDTIFINDKNQYILFDWKRRADLDYHKKKVAMIQLDLYRLLWEQHEEKQISNMYICSIFPTNNHIEISDIGVEDVLPQVREFLDKEAIKEVANSIKEIVIDTCSSQLYCITLALV